MSHQAPSRRAVALAASLALCSFACETKTVTMCMPSQSPPHALNQFTGPSRLPGCPTPPFVSEDGTIPYDIEVKADGRWIPFEKFREIDGGVSSRAEDLSFTFRRTYWTLADPIIRNEGESTVHVQGLSVSGLWSANWSAEWLSNGYQSWSISPLVPSHLLQDTPGPDRDTAQGHNTDVVSVAAGASWWYAVSPSLEAPHMTATARSWKTRFLNPGSGPRQTITVVQGATGDSKPLTPGAEAAFESVKVDYAIPRSPITSPSWDLFQPTGISTPFIPVGWNSWNTLFDKVTETDILSNAKFIKKDLPELGINNIQVDDGWEKSWGDWEANEKFPDGMDGTARKIRELGFIPGIWFAPFLVDETSSIAKEHPDWFQRGFDNELIKYGVANFGGGATKLILDTTHPEANAWMLGQIRKIVGWGYRYLKLDFLFGGAIEGKRFDPAKTSIEAYRDAMTAIAAAAGPDAYILACGAPILPSIGIAHGIRIGPDVAFFNLPLEWRYLKAEVLNLATRHFLWPDIAPDPDAALVRDLPENEARFYLSAALMAPGIFAIGDHLPTLPPDRLDLYRRIAKLIPLLYDATPGSQFNAVPNLFEYPARILPKTNLEPYIVPGSFPIPPVWIRKAGDTTIVALLNGEDTLQSVQVDLEAQGIKGRWNVEEIFSSERMTLSGTLAADLSPREGRLYLFSSP